MKKLLAVFLVFCFCLFVLLGCKEETIDDVININNDNAALTEAAGNNRTKG